MGDQAEGMYAEDIRRGALIDGMRVVGMSPARVDGRGVIVVRLDDGTKSGQSRTYTVGARVSGTRRRTDVPAGPVRSGNGTHYTRPGRRDGESARDRHSRLIDGLVYA